MILKENHDTHPMIDTFAPVQQTGSWRAQAEVFSELFTVFLAVGTVVGIVVITYTLYHAYKYRDTREEEAEAEAGDGFDAPQLGELPAGQEGGKSKKLFLSFGLSAIIVVSVVVYSYSLLLYVEEGPEVESDMDVDVTGIQFAWLFEYPNGQTSTATMRVPAGENHTIGLRVTSNDVWHAFRANDLRVKADAIPGETSRTWFIADEPGTYRIDCLELCGASHSQMTGEIVVMEPDEFNEWYDGTYEVPSSESEPEPQSQTQSVAEVSS
jgi:cytochrome c oxidase subunit 2